MFQTIGTFVEVHKRGKKDNNVYELATAVILNVCLTRMYVRNK